ncbi:hypothetical protein BDQ12DRAFT_714193, partial [Crucibulum laeve]
MLLRYTRHLGELLFHSRYSSDNSIGVLPHAYDRVLDVNFGENIHKIHLGEIAIAKPMALTSFPHLENLELVAINFSEGPEILAWWANSGETPNASQILIPGRPVEDVTFEQQYWTEDLSSEDGYLRGQIALQQIVLSSARLRRLCLPRVAHGSIILATIARLFPELCYLEIEIKSEIPLCEDDYNSDSDTGIGSITRNFADTSLQPERHRYQTLDPITHDPSMADIPVDEEGLAIRSIKSFHGIMDRLTLGEISLPRNIEVLQITQQCFRSHTYFSISQHCRVLEDLPRLYPLLKRLVIS